MGVVNIKHGLEELRKAKRGKPLACSSGVIVNIGGRKFRKHFGYRVFNKKAQAWEWGIPPSYWEIK